MGLSNEQMAGIISMHKKRAVSIDYQKWDKWRSWYGSHFWAENEAKATGAGGDDDSDLTFEQNYPFAFIETMIANVCPQNPQVTVTARSEEARPAAKVREALINDAFSRAKLHKTLWTTSTYAALYGLGFVKAVWNIRREEPDYIPIDPHYVYFDKSVAKWEDIRYLIEVTVLTRDEFDGRVKGKGKKKSYYNSRVAANAQYGSFPSWLRDNAQDKSVMNEASRDVFQWVVVYEFYDFTEDGGKYYHFLEDMDKPLFRGDMPYSAVRNPYGLLTFNDNLLDIGGLSDIQLIAPIQERLNELDTLELWHAQSSIPVLLLHGGMVDRPEVFKEAYRNATEPGACISVEGKPEMPLRDLFGQTPVPALSPSFDKMRERSIHAIEFTLAIPQYARGVVGITDVATEVALADSATRTRNGRRQKEVYDLVGWCARATMGLFEEFLSPTSSVPVRVSGDPEGLQVTRDTLAARGLEELMGEEPMQYDYMSVPYSPTENNRLLQMRNLRESLAFLVQNPFVDQQKLTRKMLDLLMLSDIVNENPQAPGGLEGMVGLEGMGGGGGGDTVASGALPPGLEGAGGTQQGLMGGAGQNAPEGGPPLLTGMPPMPNS